jgi:hypothetical protein
LSLPSPINWLATSSEVKRLTQENIRLKQIMSEGINKTEQGVGDILKNVEVMQQAAGEQIAGYREGMRLIIETLESIIGASIELGDLQLAPTAPIQVLIDTVRESPLLD